MYVPLKIQQLRYVVAVADYGGYSFAAEALHRTQPAISLGIKELEARFGEPIFERQGAGRLTPFLVPYACRNFVSFWDCTIE